MESQKTGPGRLRRLVGRLRVEEAIALAFLAPTAYLTLYAQRYAQTHGLLGARFPGGVLRFGLAVLLLGALWGAKRLWPRSNLIDRLRDVLPFVTCILIYTNLHDTIGFVNSHDVHQVLVHLDKWLFGVEPCVWAERFITPARTEVMVFFYGNFAWLAPCVPLILLFQRRWQDFRSAVLGIVVCFYLGYALYLVFPAAPPRLYLAHEFHVNLKGYPNMLFALEQRTLSLLPADSRAAFPSLHAAVTLLALFYAWRYTRRWLILLVPLVLGLWVSTIYLRHHYFVDLLAGWALAPLAVWLAPRLDRWWNEGVRRRAPS